MGGVDTMDDHRKHDMTETQKQRNIHMTGVRFRDWKSKARVHNTKDTGHRCPRTRKASEYMAFVFRYLEQITTM